MMFIFHISIRTSNCMHVCARTHTYVSNHSYIPRVKFDFFFFFLILKINDIVKLIIINLVKKWRTRKNSNDSKTRSRRCCRLLSPPSPLLQQTSQLQRSAARYFLLTSQISDQSHRNREQQGISPIRDLSEVQSSNNRRRQSRT